MTAIPQGVPFRVVLQGVSTLLKCDKEVLAEMTPYLSNQNLLVLSETIDLEDAGAFSCLYPGSFTATLNLQSANDTDDLTVNNQVAQAYYLVTKAAPAGISIPLVGGTNTGQPGTGGGTPTPGCGDPNADFVTQFFCKLQSLGTSLLIGLAAVVIVVLLIIAYGPNVPKVSGSFA